MTGGEAGPIPSAATGRASPLESSDNGYWRDAGLALARGPARPLWRKCCDSLNRRWLERQLEEHRFAAALKTDLFDEAAGEGVFPFLRGKADRVRGIDVSTPICRLAGNRYPGLAAAACDVRGLPFRGGTFDLILSLSTLDHFSTEADIHRGLKSLYEALRPGGCLLITLDNLSNPAVRLRNSIPWRLLSKTGLVPYRVGATLDPGGLKEALENAGFETRHISTLMHAPRVVAVALAGLLDGAAGPLVKRLFCRAIAALEHLSRLPTARWTGHYIAAMAVKPGGARGR